MLWQRGGSGAVRGGRFRGIRRHASVSIVKGCYVEGVVYIRFREVDI